MQNLKQKYYLYVGRLVEYKKVDFLVEVFNKLKEPLLIVGTGFEESKLRSMSTKNIKFAGQVSDEELIKIYKGAKALVMPQEEDFGIVSVEAQLLGVPVIAYRKGGAVDTVVNGKTGILFNQQNEESLVSAIEKFREMSFNYEELVSNAKKFSKQAFKKEFLKRL
jgi:glycosyltransferase involved in cell wall biosynthesis